MRRAIVFVSLLVACKSLPTDPDHTLERVEHGTLRVGYAVHEPWVSGLTAEPTGVEAELVRRLARQLDAQLRWSRGSEEELADALRKHELDLAIGGFVDDDPTFAKVGRTQPYVKTRTCVGVAIDDRRSDLHGRAVTVRTGDPAAAELEDVGRIHRVLLPSPTDAPILAPDWTLEAYGLRNTQTCPRKEAHVLLVAPGENRFLMRLERFLDGEHPRDALVASARRS